MEKRIETFVAHARSKGMDHATIRMLLLSTGWKEKDVAEALTAESLDMPVPVPPDRGGAREAFLHLITFAGLYTTTISLIVLFFTYLNRLLPDPAVDMYPVTTAQNATIRWSMAAIIVTYPIVILLSRTLLREIHEAPEKAFSLVRRWLTYLTLFVAALALIVDGITLLFNLLQGELSLRFVFKVIVVLVIAGLVFSYYFLSLRHVPAEHS